MATVTLTDRFESRELARPKPAEIRVEPSVAIDGGVFLSPIGDKGQNYHVSFEDAVALRDALNDVIQVAGSTPVRLTVEVPTARVEDFREDVEDMFGGKVIE